MHQRAQSGVAVGFPARKKWGVPELGYKEEGSSEPTPQCHVNAASKIT